MKFENLVRLNKFMADSGVTSRRKADRMILEGRVQVNGRICRELGFKVLQGKDVVRVDGNILQEKEMDLYVLLNKPSGYVTTLHDPEGRKTIKDLLSGFPARLYPVGRLDYASEGLLLLTNDGIFAQKLNHPESEITKEYLVKVEGRPDLTDLAKLKTGVTLKEGKIRPLEFEKIRRGPNHDWFRIVVSKGKNRLVQRMFEKIGFDVLKIKRIAIGQLKLGGLDRGDYKMINRKEASRALLPRMVKKATER